MLSGYLWAAGYQDRSHCHTIVSVTYLGGAEPPGLGFVKTMSSRTDGRELVSRDRPLPEGPWFQYALGPDLFLGRRGRGPLRIMWDTNLLIDYFEYGRQIWDGESLPESLPGEYGEELEGLQLLLSVWVLRDIRFTLPEGALDDAKRQMSGPRVQRRVRALAEFGSALEHVDWEYADEDLPPLFLPARELERALASIPVGGDRRLVGEAVRRGMHVFLTRDKRVLKAASHLRPFGLVLASPLDVLELLCACGGFHCVLDPSTVTWPIPDMQRVSHLLDAMGLVETPQES